MEKSYEKDVISNSIMNVASVIFITIITILEKCVDCVCKNKRIVNKIRRKNEGLFTKRTIRPTQTQHRELSPDI